MIDRAIREPYQALHGGFPHLRTPMDGGEGGGGMEK